MSSISAPASNHPRFETDRLLHRIVWCIWAVVLVGAAGYHWVKVQEGRGAFVRWRPQVLSFVQGVNIFDKQMFPNPPIFPITVYPIMALPESVGAMTWFALKCALATLAALMCFRMAKNQEDALSPWVVAITLALAFRTIESDLHHANNNIIILALIVSSLHFWRKGWDVPAGLLMALAISFKVTPGLFIPYFMYKRSWKMVASILFGMVLFVFVVPSVFIGWSFNMQCLASWWKRILNPFISEGVASRQEMNQSLVGVMFRLWTPSPQGGRYDPELQLEPLYPLAHRTVEYLVKGFQLAFVALLALFCRTNAKRRLDPRLLGEFSLVVLTMLIVSERSWKHHFVTLLLPYAYLVYRCFDPTIGVKAKRVLVGALVLATLLMATTSSEIGGWFYGGEGHSLAQWFGMFLWGAVVLYAATAWRLMAERSSETARSIASPHFVSSAKSGVFVKH